MEPFEWAEYGHVRVSNLDEMFAVERLLHILGYRWNRTCPSRGLPYFDEELLVKLEIVWGRGESGLSFSTVMPPLNWDDISEGQKPRQRPFNRKQQRQY